MPEMDENISVEAGINPVNKKTAKSLLYGMLLVPVLACGQQGNEETLDIYYIDTEGGQSTLFVSPKGESLLVDTGNGGGRDAKRILEAINDAGLSQIDHMWTTHYHFDHVGALEDSPGALASIAKHLY